MIRTAPDLAISAPTSYAAFSWAGVQPLVLLPITRIWVLAMPTGARDDLKYLLTRAGAKDIRKPDMVHGMERRSMPVCFTERQYRMIQEYAKRNGMLNASQALERILDQ